MIMTGWKTWAAAIGGFATGIATIANGCANDFDIEKIRDGLLVCFGALGVVGIGHKLDKAKTAKRNK